MDTILRVSLDLLAWLSDYRQFTRRWDLATNPDGCGERYAAERAALMERRGVILAAICAAEARAAADPDLGYGTGQ